MRMPIRNVGSEIPIRDTAWNTLVRMVSRRSAEYTPIRMPNTMEKIVAQAASSSVAGIRSISRFETGWRN